MASLIDDRAMLDDEEEDESFDEETGEVRTKSNGDPNKFNDSSEEDEDDEDEEARAEVARGFIVDEEEEEDDDAKAERRRLRKLARRNAKGRGRRTKPTRTLTRKISNLLVFEDLPQKPPLPSSSV
jgi:transcription elongation factor SPT6